MIYIPELDVYVDEIPKDLVHAKVIAHLRKNLTKGYCIFVVPERFDYIDKNQKHIKKSYKVGFIYDMLGRIFPGMEKQAKHKVIDQNYHMFVTYRQFFTLLEFYESNRNKFYTKDGFQ